MAKLLISRACEQRLQTGMPLAGAFALECITKLEQSIADMGMVTETLRTWEQAEPLFHQVETLIDELEQVSAALLKVGDKQP